ANGLANFKTVKKSMEENVYERSKGCTKHWTMLYFILELLILKAKHDWSDGSFNDLLSILAWLLPKPNRVPTNTYRAKKLVSPFTMGVERIHACPNRCILYRGDTFKGLDKCHVCSASRYENNSSYCDDERQGPTDGNKRKRKGARNSIANVEPEDTTLGIFEKQSRIPTLVMWYLHIADRLRRFFSNPKDAELMRWWDLDKHKKDGHYVFNMVRTILVPYGKMTKDGKRNTDKPAIDGMPFKKLSIFYKYLLY
uniref:Uncharacterized protein n=1 Tax=Setaria italica TaxID=4555 RepID=K4AI41_SETIT